MKHKLLNTLFLLFFLTITTYASVFEHETSLKEIDKKLPELNSITCKFAQEKQIAPSGIILKSSGDFEFKKNQGIVFYTTYPIKSVVSYNTREYKHVNNVINAISTKSYSKLEREFKFYYAGTVENWTLGLLPKQESATYNYLKSIEISGNKTMITTMTILAADSTKTKIKFFN